MSNDIVTISMQPHDRNCAACGDLCSGGYAIPMLEGLIVSNEWKGPRGGFQACHYCYEQHRQGRLPTHDEELSCYLTSSTPTTKDAELTRLRKELASMTEMRNDWKARAESSDRHYYAAHDEASRLRALIAHLEARLKVEMAEVEEWRKRYAMSTFVLDKYGTCPICAAMAATDASRKAEKEKQ